MSHIIENVEDCQGNISELRVTHNILDEDTQEDYSQISFSNLNLWLTEDQREQLINALKSSQSRFKR